MTKTQRQKDSVTETQRQKDIKTEKHIQTKTERNIPSKKNVYQSFRLKVSSLEAILFFI